MADLLAAVASSSHSSSSLSADGKDENGAAIGLSSEQLASVKESAISWAAAHGLLVGWRDPTSKAPSATFTHIPFCLLPVQLPKAQFEHGIALSPVYGRLVDRVSRDIEWLHSTVSTVVAEDAFTGRLLELSKLVQAEGVQQKAYLGIHRSDYMLHEPQADIPNDYQRLLQVELNTISSSFACISSLVSDLHSFLINRLGKDIPALESYYSLKSDEFRARLPANAAIRELPDALAAAHKHYGVKDAIIVFVVQPNEANAIDQRWLEYNLWEHHGIKVLRKTLAEVEAQAVLRDDAKRTLVIDGYEVAVAYYRSGYTPLDYPSETEWSGRTKIERSFAIKCPSIAYHLAGTKKVQQALAVPAALRRFVSNDEAELLESSFAGLYGLEKENLELEKIKQMAIANPKAFVVKPQREGGGNNLYGDEVAHAMQTFSPTELESYILMARIFPKENPAVLVRNSVTAAGGTISELGMYITSLFDDGKEILNKHAGHLLRTKLSGTDEGGVATGFSVPEENADGDDSECLFRVVYDPTCDRFFLQDELTLSHKSQHNSSPPSVAPIAPREGKMSTIPWDQWMLPPKSTSKKQQQLAQVPDALEADMARLTLQEGNASTALTNACPPMRNQFEAAATTTTTTPEGGLLLPQLDLSLITSATAPDSISSRTQDPPAAAATSSTVSKQITTPSAKKARIRSYVTHFANANNSANDILPSTFSAELCSNNREAHEIKWNGEPIRVKVACKSSRDSAYYRENEGVRTNDNKSSNQDGDGDGNNDDDITIQHLFELPQLLRIRPHADGFRGTNVNADCIFTPLTSPSSSSSSSSSSSEFSDDGNDALPEFRKGDRVLFRAKYRCLKGKIARRIKKSSFYDVKAANGTLFLAVSALRIRLLPEDEQEEETEPPVFNFQRGDRVLWLPVHAKKSSKTYKARVLKLRSLQRFDLQLRTGRVVAKIPYEELRPRTYDS